MIINQQKMRGVSALCLLLMNTGCVRYQMVQSGSDSATVDLAESAYTINQNLQSLTASDQESPMKIKKQVLNPNTYGMGRLASVDWNGPAETLVKKIAGLTQYRVKVFGREPALPVLVSVTERDEPLGEILRKVSLQSNKQLKLLLYPSDQLIELHYLN